MKQFHQLYWLPIIRNTSRTFFLAFVTSCLLAACSAPLQPGQTQELVAKVRGQPSARYALPGGAQRWAYAATFGQQTWMVDFDASGKLLRSYPALSDSNFAKIVVGSFDKADIAREFGPPAHTDIVGWGQYTFEVWSYRYQQADTANSLMHVHFGKDGKVAKYYPGPDPYFEPRESRGL